MTLGIYSSSFAWVVLFHKKVLPGDGLDFCLPTGVRSVALNYCERLHAVDEYNGLCDLGQGRNCEMTRLQRMV